VSPGEHGSSFLAIMTVWPLVGLGPCPFDRHRLGSTPGSSEHDVAVPADRDRVEAGFTADCRVAQPLKRCRIEAVVMAVTGSLLKLHGVTCEK
jgi:hypothetical protein